MAYIKKGDQYVINRNASRLTDDKSKAINFPTQIAEIMVKNIEGLSIEVSKDIEVAQAKTI